MLEYISQLFEYLVCDKGYQKSMEDVTHVVKDLVYSNNNIKLVFTCELMDYQFDFEVCYSIQGKEHSVCEWKGRRELHYQNLGINVVHHSIFAYTKGTWSEISFQDEKEKLLHKYYGFGRTKKYFCDNIALYKLLLVSAIDCIEQIVCD